VLSVGGEGEMKPWRDRNTRVIDLRGAFVIPGLVDAHAHMDREGLKYLLPSLARCRSIAEVRALIRAQAATRAPGEWIVTMPVGAPPFYLDPQVARIKRLGAVATTNPISYLWRSGATEAARVGSDVDHMIPHASLARRRVPFGLATDNKPANPWLAFVAAVERRDMVSGAVLGPRERLTRLRG
jgi:predicted amidohydrolase YtcJ